MPPRPRIFLPGWRQLPSGLELLDGRILINDIAIEAVGRIWPVLVTADLMVTPQLHELIRRETQDTLSLPKTQPLTLLAPQDLETLMGLVGAGESLVGLLEAKTTGPWREFELNAWLKDDQAAPNPQRSAFSEELWEEATDSALRLLRLIPAGRFSKKHRSIYHLVRAERWLAQALPKRATPRV